MSGHATRPAALNPSQIKEALIKLNGWSVDQSKLYKEFVFDDFTHAMAFMVRAIEFIEQINHHPEWFNVYNKVRVHLVTHDVAGSKDAAITELDLKLADHLNTIS